ncbi:MAG TPA: PAS domain-containing protein [Actinomycetota bacterium]|nr:PAS domain-containing protein [Actinomycetota bacterium]
MKEQHEHNLVLILARGLASSIATPMFLVDPEGTLVYYNEPAEAIFGESYAEAGELSPDEWGTRFSPEDPNTGEQLGAQALPLSVALAEKKPDHRLLTITGRDGKRRMIAVTAFPLFARTNEFVGGVAIFWEAGEA